MNKIKFMIVLTILCMVQVQYYMQILDLKLEFMMKSPMPNEPNEPNEPITKKKGEKQN